jgi:hypothetical protein
MNGLEKEIVVPTSWRLRSGQPLLCLAKISKGQLDSFAVEVTQSQMTILLVDLSNTIACSAPLW